MSMQSVFAGFSQEALDEYKDEVKARWGNTTLYKQSQKRTQKWSKEDYRRVAQEYDAIAIELAALMDHEPSHPEVQTLIARQHSQINQFYDCSLEMFRALGQMYVDDVRFRNNYNRHRPGLALFMRDAVDSYCDARERQ